jgi:hypothetical protein
VQAHTKRLAVGSLVTALTTAVLANCLETGLVAPGNQVGLCLFLALWMITGGAVVGVLVCRDLRCVMSELTYEIAAKSNPASRVEKGGADV